MFFGWGNRPYITAALIRSVDTVHAALREGADGVIISWTVLRDLLQHTLTDQSNETFMSEWMQMHKDGKLDDLPVKLSH